MLAKVMSCAVAGLEGSLVEVDIAPGLPAFNIVGLPDTAVQEARERVCHRHQRHLYRCIGDRVTLAGQPHRPVVRLARGGNVRHGDYAGPPGLQLFLQEDTFPGCNERGDV